MKVHLAFAQDHDERINQIRHVIIQYQQTAGHATFRIRVGKTADMASVRMTLQSRRKTLPQHTGQILK